MITQSKIKLIRSLEHKKYRNKEGLFIAEGEKTVKELLLHNNYEIVEIYALQTWINNNIELIKSVQTISINETTLNKISQLSTPNKVLALVKTKCDETIGLKSLENKITLMLDDIKDPGNMGTIIRIADWFAIENIICSEDSVDIYNNKVIQSSMGSYARINVYYTNLVEFAKAHKDNFHFYGSFMNGQNIYESKLLNNSIIIMGNEANGISQELQRYIKNQISIPLYNISPNHAESLNVGVATGIICAEFKRQIPAQS